MDRRLPGLRPRARQARLVPPRQAVALPKLVALAALVVLAPWPALTPAAQAQVPQPAAPAAARPSFTDQLATLINAYRARHGLAPLQPADRLSRIAQDHAHTLARAGRLSHDGFGARFERADRDLCVENLAHNHPSPEAVLLGWQRSPEHHRNLLEPRVTHVGLGHDTRVVTFFACG